MISFFFLKMASPVLFFWRTPKRRPTCFSQPCWAANLSRRGGRDVSSKKWASRENGLQVVRMGYKFLNQIQPAITLKYQFFLDFSTLYSYKNQSQPGIKLKYHLFSHKISYSYKCIFMFRATNGHLKVQLSLGGFGN